MESAEVELIFNAIRNSLETSQASSQDTNIAAKNLILILNRISIQLEPMIGVQGVEVLFNRALYLSSKELTWIETSVDLDKVNLIASIAQQLESVEMHEASKAGYTILMIFTKLLITLIGESLTIRLLEPVWTIESPLQASKELHHE